MLIDYEVRGNRPVVHKWHRSKTNKQERHHEVIRDFEPYLYVHVDEDVPEDDERVKRVEHGDWQSNQGHPLKRVYTYSPKDVGGYSGVKSEFSQTWESDVYFRSRYWLDEIDVDEDQDFKARDYRVCMYDIEVDHSLDAAHAPEEIISLTAYDNYLEKYVSFLLLPPNGKKVEGFKNDDWSLYTFDPDDYEEDTTFTASEKAERQMVIQFLEFIKDTNPDIISAWNGAGYDDPYLFNRCRRLNIDYTDFSPINRVSLNDGNERVSLKGRELIDMIPAFKKVYFSELESYSLNNVGTDLLGMEKIRFQGTGAQLWRDNPEKLIEYNMRDVEIMVELDDKFKVWDMLQEVQEWVGINISDILHNSRVTQAYFMRRMDSAIPPKGWDKDVNSFEGAKVLEETPGVSKNVAVLDLKAQYPSSMISYNMSPEMKIEDDMEDTEIAEKFLRPVADGESDWTDEEIEDHFGYSREELKETVDGVVDDYAERLVDVISENTVEVGTGAKFWYGEMGTIPEVLIEMIQERDEHKELRDAAEPGSDVYEHHDRRQFALKFVINSVYGVMGFPKFPLYDRDVAASTTYVGRETIEWAVKAANDLGYEVVYGDTDSVMISMGEDVTIEQAIEKAGKLEDYINETYDEYAAEHGVDTSRFEDVEREHFFEIEFEKLYETFFMQKSQKKYAGKIVYKEGKRIDDYDFAQFGKRSSAAKVSNKVVRTVLKKILDGEDLKSVREYVTNVCTNMKDEEYDLDYIGIPSRMKKELDEYKTDRPILRGVKFTNQYLDEEFGKDDKPKYVYVKGTPPGMPNTDVVAFSEMTLPEGFIVDWDTMINKDIQQKLRKILNVMDWQWREVYRTSGSLLDF